MLTTGLKLMLLGFVGYLGYEAYQAWTITYTYYLIGFGLLFFVLFSLFIHYMRVRADKKDMEVMQRIQKRLPPPRPQQVILQPRSISPQMAPPAVGYVDLPQDRYEML
jgi:hypothetical protein